MAEEITLGAKTVTLRNRDDSVDSVEKRIVGRLLGELIKEGGESKYVFADDRIESAIEKTPDLKEKISELYDSIKTKTLKQIIDTYGFELENEKYLKQLSGVRINQLLNESYTERLFGEKRFQDFKYTRKPNTIKKSMVKVEVKQTKRKATHKLVTFDESEDSILTAKGFKAKEMFDAGVQPYLAPPAGEKSYDLREYLGLKPEKLPKDFEELYLKTGKMSESYRKVKQNAEKAVKRLEDDLNKLIKEDEKARELIVPYLQLLGMTKKDIVGPSRLNLEEQDTFFPTYQADSDRQSRPTVTYGGTFSDNIADIEMLEMNRGYGYFKYMMETLKDEVAKISVDRATKANIFTAISSITKIEEQRDKLKKIALENIMYDKEFLEKQPQVKQYLDQYYSKDRAAEDTAEQAMLEKYFKEPHKLVDENLPEDLSLYKMEFTIGEVKNMKGELTGYSVFSDPSTNGPKPKLTRVKRLRPASLTNPGDIRGSRKLRINGEYVEDSKELPTVDSRQDVMELITDLRTNDEDLTRAIGE